MRPPTRRWLQFNMKALFAAVLVSAVACTLFGRYWATRPLSWQPFSTKSRDSALASGNVVLIKFTADWDFGSARLDKAFMDSSDLRSLVRRNNIVAIHADYTRQTKTIANELVRLYGQEAVPLVAIYLPNKPAVPFFLDYIVEEDDLLAALRQALAAKRSSIQ